MPYKDPADRDYKQEWQNEKKRGTKALKAKLARQTARRTLDKKGVSREGKDIDHKKPLANGGSNKPSNWRLTSPSANRSFKRKSDHTPK